MCEEELKERSKKSWRKYFVEEEINEESCNAKPPSDTDSEDSRKSQGLLDDLVGCDYINNDDKVLIQQIIKPKERVIHKINLGLKFDNTKPTVTRCYPIIRGRNTSQLVRMNKSIPKRIINNNKYPVNYSQFSLDNKKSRNNGYNDTMNNKKRIKVNETTIESIISQNKNQNMKTSSYYKRVPKLNASDRKSVV